MNEQCRCSLAEGLETVRCQEDPSLFLFMLFCLETLLGRIWVAKKQKKQTPRERFVKKEQATVMSHAALREEVATKVARALESSRDEVLADRIIKRAVEFPQTDFPKWREGKEPKARRS